MPDPVPTTFGSLLRARAAVLGLVSDDGAASIDRVSQFLSARNVTGAGPSAVRSWFMGERVPRRGRMELVLDELGVHGDLRLLAYRLAARVEPESAVVADPVS